MSNHSKLTHRRRLTSSSGFTLIELVLVLTIIAILAGAGINMIVGNIDRAKETRVISDINTLKVQLQGYEGSNYRPPTGEQGLKALWEKPTIDPIPENWSKSLEEELKDPWGNPYQYKNPAERSGKAYDIFSSGKDGIPGNEGI